MPSLTRWDPLLPYHICLTTDFLAYQTTVSQFVDVDKVNLFRVAFLMERMVPIDNGLGSDFNETVHFFV